MTALPTKHVPLAIQLLNAIVRSDLPRELRHVLMTLVHLADHVTGEGYSGQATIARAVGCTDRQIRRSLDAIDALVAQGKSPVALTRTRRGRPGGFGRNSDLYRLTLVPELNRTSMSASATSEVGLNRTPVSASGGDVAAFDEKLNRTSETPQPDIGDSLNRTSTSYDLVRDLGSELVREDLPVAEAPVGNDVVHSTRSKGTPRKSAKAKPKAKLTAGPTDPLAGQRHQRVVAHYCSEFERVRGVKPLFHGAEGTSVKRLLEKCQGDADLACRIITLALPHPANPTIRIIASDPDRFRNTKAPADRFAKPVQKGAIRDEGAAAKQRAAALLG